MCSLEKIISCLKKEIVQSALYDIEIETFNHFLRTVSTFHRLLSIYKPSCEWSSQRATLPTDSITRSDK